MISLVGMGCQNDDSDQEATLSNQSEEEIYFEDYTAAPNKWGYLDTNGQVIIAPQFDAVRNFNQGLAAVNSAGKWGMIDTAGNWIIKPSFQGIWAFNNGLARVKVFEKGHGFIDRSNRLIIPPEYEEAYDFSSYRSRIKEGAYYGYIDKQNRQVIPPTFAYASDFIKGKAVVKKDEKYGLIDTSGNWIIKNEYDRVQYDSFMDGVLVKQNNAYRHFSHDGNMFITKSYAQSTPFYKDRAWIKNETGWSLIDKTGKTISIIQARRIIYGGEDHWLIQQDNGFTISDMSGNVLTDGLYDQINRFSEGRAAYYKKPMWGYLDTQGKEIMGPRYFLIWDFKGGVARVADETGNYFIDRSGKEVLRGDYVDVRDFFENRARFQEQ